MSTKQLYEKTSEGMKEVSPLVSIEDIYSKPSDTPLEALVSLFNHVKCEWKGSVADTRRTVPLFLRRSGLFITYNNGTKYITEFFSAGVDQITTEGWVKDSNWTFVPDEDYISAGVKPGVGSIGYEQLNDNLKQLFREKVNVTNFPDDEDIASVDNMFKLKDREVDAAKFQSKGYVILRKNLRLVNGVVKNILTQDMINQDNTIYEIRYDFDLNGETINVPENCTLKFEGGSISNGTIRNVIIYGDYIRCSCNIENCSFIPNYVTYTQFGALMNGTSNDYDSIRKCHEFANKYKLKVVQDNGTIIIHSTSKIPVETDTDLSKCTFLISNDYVYGEGYNIQESADNQFIDVSSIANSNKNIFAKGVNNLYSLSPYKESFFKIEGSRILGNRVGSSIHYKNQECFTISSEGAIIDGDLYCDYTKDDITLQYKSIKTNPIIVKLPKIEFNTSLVLNYQGIFSVNRNNSTIIMPSSLNYINYPSEGGESSSVPYIVNCEDSYGIKVIGGKGENKGRIIGEDLQRTCYIIRFTRCSQIEITGLNYYRGWGALNTEFIKTIYVHNCILNRFDNHFGISNLIFCNSKVVGNNNAVNIGYGNGYANIYNIEWLYIRTNSNSQTRFLLVRADLGLPYEGTINIHDIKIESGLSNANLGIVSLYIQNFNYDNYISTLQTKAIIINNVDVSGNQIGSLSIVTLNNERSDKSYKVSNVTINNINTTLNGCLIGASTNVTLGTLRISDSRLDNMTTNYDYITNAGSQYIGTIYVNNSIIPSISLPIKIVYGGSFIVDNSEILGSRIYQSKLNTYISNSIIYPFVNDSRNEFYTDKYHLVNCRFLSNKSLDSNDLYLYGKDNIECTCIGLRCALTVHYVTGKTFNNVFFDYSVNKRRTFLAYNSSSSLSGNSSNRPTNEYAGFQYFDTTLKKPIWWTGEKWVDATGADV